MLSSRNGAVARIAQAVGDNVQAALRYAFERSRTATPGAGRRKACGPLTSLTEPSMETQPNTPDARAPLVGTWKLKSNIMERKATGERHLVHGEDPNGCLIFTPEGRLMAILNESGREPVRDRDDAVRLFKILVAYSGRYRVQGDKFITKVDISWNKWWNGQEHVRYFKITGDELEIVSAWEPLGPVLGSPLVRTIATWERAV